MSKNEIVEPSLKDIFNLVVNLKDNFIELKSDVGEIKKDISRLDKRIEEVHERIDEVHKRVDEVHGKVKEVNERIDEVHGRVDEVHSRIEEVHERIDEVHGRVDEVHGRVDEVHERIDEVHGRIDYYHKSRKIDKFDELYGLKEVLALDIVESKNLKWANEIIEKIAKLYPSKTYKKIWICVSKNLYEQTFKLLNQVDTNNLLKKAKWFQV